MRLGRLAVTKRQAVALKEIDIDYVVKTEEHDETRHFGTLQEAREAIRNQFEDSIQWVAYYDYGSYLK
jgi:hypothetical protein